VLSVGVRRCKIIRGTAGFFYGCELGGRRRSRRAA
jgi:hypothetical protein